MDRTMKKSGINDWVCPYCQKVLYDGGNKLRHLAKHEPCIRRLIMDNFKKTMTVNMRRGC